MTVDPTAGLPRHGDVTGEPHPGHRVTRIWAAVVIYPNGDEGMASTYTFNDAGHPIGRLTFVTSDPKMLRLLKRSLGAVTPPPGGRIEWREFHT